MNVLRHETRVPAADHWLRHAALPFVVLASVFVAGATSTLLPAGLAFALAFGCVLAGAFRALLVYRDRLVALRARGAKH
jgi:hypothetical protein